MKVLQVIDRLEIGGAEKLFAFLSNLLQKQEVDVSVLLFESGYPIEKELHNSLPVHVLNRVNKFNFVMLYKAHKVCKKYAIVHTHLRHVHAYIRLAQIIFRGNYKLLLHDHADVSVAPSFRMKGLFKPKYYIGVNNKQTNWARDQLGIEKRNIFFLENRIASPRKKYNYDGDRRRMMMVANIREEKNIEFAIDLCNYLKVGLTIYGNSIDQEYYSKIKGLIGDSDVKIIQGVSDLSNEYDQFSLAIHCSPIETGPIVLLEYLSVGIPFIAYKTGSIADAISKHLPILFMESYDLSEWNERISRTEDDPDISQKMTKLFQEQFSPEQYINKCTEIYRNLLS